MTDYSTMKDIGKDFGMTSHQLGKILKTNQLRTDEGRPSEKAFELEMVSQKHDEFGHYLWAWHTRKVEMLLEHLGHVRQTGNSVT